MYKNLDILQPQSELHYTKLINSQNVDISFRYFSPSKFMKQNRNSNQLKMSLSPSSANSSRKFIHEPSDRQQQSDIKNKYSITPQQLSSKFYFDSINQIQLSLLRYYQHFHQKLLTNLTTPTHPPPKTIKIKLTKIKQDKPNNHHHPKKKNIYIRNVQINLQQEQVYINDQKICNNRQRKNNQRNNLQQSLVNSLTPAGQQNGTKRRQQNKKNQCKIKIKLYENQQNIINHWQLSRNQNSFKTPRKTSNSNKKGIFVFSSTKTNKKMSEQQPKNTNNKQNMMASSYCNQNKDKGIETQRKSIKHQQKIFVYLLSSKRQPKTSARQNKNDHPLTNPRNRMKTQSRRRAISKDKLKKTGKPIIKQNGNQFGNAIKK